MQNLTLKTLIFAILISPPLFAKGNAYHLKKGCYAIQHIQSGKYLMQHPHKDGISQTRSLSKAEKFYVNPTRLGNFQFITTDQKYLSHRKKFLNYDAHPSTENEWSVQLHHDNQYSFKNIPETLALGIGASSKIEMLSLKTLLPKQKEAIFNLLNVPQDQCFDFPELPLNAIVKDGFYAPRPTHQPVVGLVDSHTHISFPKTMASQAMSGDVFHPYGMLHALGSCEKLHGVDGKGDLLEGKNLEDGKIHHSNDGHPRYTYWPNRTTVTHVQAYHRWLERAHFSGLKMIVNHVTGNPTFCQLLALKGKLNGHRLCKGTDAVKQQSQYMFQMQDYIDAQAGGPGKGWLKIVTSPSEAREAIAQNKLAVILGIEHGNLFNCTERNKACDFDYIDKKLDEAYDLGIRSIFPLHRFDNAFGGTRPQGHSSGAWMHLSSMLSTSRVKHLTDVIDPTKLLFKPLKGHFWDLKPCPAGINGVTEIRNMKKFFKEEFAEVNKLLSKVPVVGPLLNYILNKAFLKKLKPIPTYKEYSANTPLCNQKRLTPKGRHLVNRLIDKGMIIEIDHLSYFTLLDVLDILEERQYPGFISSHGWIENQPEIRQRIYQLGGMITPSYNAPSKTAKEIRAIEKELPTNLDYFPVAFGSDIQGVARQAESDAHIQVTYPFKSYDGHVTFIKPKYGHRTFDYNTEGVSHYGLLPEWLENLRQVDAQTGQHSLEILMNSAENYLRMWEKVYR